MSRNKCTFPCWVVRFALAATILLDSLCTGLFCKVLHAVASELLRIICVVLSFHGHSSTSNSWVSLNGDLDALNA